MMEVDGVPNVRAETPILTSGMTVKPRMSRQPGVRPDGVHGRFELGMPAVSTTGSSTSPHVSGDRIKQIGRLPV